MVTFKPYNLKKYYIAQFLAILILSIFFSCAKEKHYRDELINNKYPEAQIEIQKVIESIVKDAESKNIEGLKMAHLNSEKFSKFGHRNFYRQDLKSTNESEETFFSSIEYYKQEILDLKIDVFGEYAVATYYPQVSFIQYGHEKKGSGRQTFVFLKTDEGWKIVHEHGTPKVQ